MPHSAVRRNAGLMREMDGRGEQKTEECGRTDTLGPHSHEMSRTGKSAEARSRLGLPGAAGTGKPERQLNG